MIKLNKKISVIALGISLLGATLTEARPSIKDFFPTFEFITNYIGTAAQNPALAFFLQYIPHKAYVPSMEQALRIKETLEDHSELDMSKISVEHDPIVFPESKEMVTVYADYKPEHHAESRLEKTKELRNWHAKLALGFGLASHLITTRDYNVGPAAHASIIKQAILNSAKTGFYYAGSINGSYAGYKALEGFHLQSQIKAAKEGDGDIARALERKAIAYQIQDME